MNDIYGNAMPSSDSIRVYPVQTDVQSFGQLQIRCTTPGLAPIANAVVSINQPGAPDHILLQMSTDDNGLTGVAELPAPSPDYSQEPVPEQPYANYDVSITAPGYENVLVANVEILPDVRAVQNTVMKISSPDTAGQEEYNIPPHTLYGDYPSKIPEAEIKPTPSTGGIVLPEVVIPEFVVVHDGAPNTGAANYYVGFRDYIKNVASSEIYATWSESTIYANVLAILSFTLNRVYTEWYRSKGYNFTITSNTAYDHKWIEGRNIYNNIDFIVDSVFNNYLSRPNVKQPILTQYCDGNRVQCPNWLSQWGSKRLGDQGYSAIDILRNYYGNSIYINSANSVSGVPSSWPGVNLSNGSRGQSVRIIQDQLNHIAQNYPAIPKLAVDGSFGPRTEEAVRAFQQIFDLPVNGIVDFPTWYKISFIYTAVTRLAA